MHLSLRLPRIYCARDHQMELLVPRQVIASTSIEFNTQKLHCYNSILYQIGGNIVKFKSQQLSTD